MTEKADKLYGKANAAFEEFGDGSLEVDTLLNYSDFLEFCDDDFLDMFTFEYNTETEYFSEEDISEDEEPGYTYIDPEIILVPKQLTPIKKIHISCRGFEIELDTHLYVFPCDVNANNEEVANNCVQYLNSIMK